MPCVPMITNKNSNFFKATFPTSSGHSVLGIFGFSFHLNTFCLRRDILEANFTNFKPPSPPNHAEKLAGCKHKDRDSS